MNDITRNSLVTLALVAGLAGSARAELRVGVPPAISPEGNAVVSAELTASEEGTLAVYFRREGRGDFYYIPMTMKSEGSGSALLPRPDAQTGAVELFVGLRGASGELLGRSSAVVVPVGGASASHQGAGGTIAVGNTVKSQDGHDVAWFTQQGISSRIPSSNGGGRDRSSSGGGTSGENHIVNNIIIVGDPGGDPKEITLPRP